MVHFVRKLRSIKPDIIIGQPTYGYPQVEAANDVINESWDTNGNLRNVVDSIGTFEKKIGKLHDSLAK